MPHRQQADGDADLRVRLNPMRLLCCCRTATKLSIACCLLLSAVFPVSLVPPGSEDEAD